MHQLTIRGNDTRDMVTACLRFINFVVHEKPIPDVDAVATSNGDRVDILFNRYYRKEPFADLPDDKPVIVPASTKPGKMIRKTPSKRKYKPIPCSKCRALFVPKGPRSKTCDKCSPATVKKRKSLRLRKACKKLHEEGATAEDWFHGVHGLPNWSIEKIAKQPDYVVEKFRVHMTQSEKNRCTRLRNNRVIEKRAEERLDRIADDPDVNA